MRMGIVAAMVWMVGFCLIHAAPAQGVDESMGIFPPPPAEDPFLIPPPAEDPFLMPPPATSQQPPPPQTTSFQPPPPQPTSYHVNNEEPSFYPRRRSMVPPDPHPFPDESWLGRPRCGRCGNYLADANGRAGQCTCSRWTLQADLALLKRTAGGSQTLLSSTDYGLDAEDLTFGFQPSPRIHLIRHGIFETPWDCEVGYMGVYGWMSHEVYRTGSHNLNLLAYGGLSVRDAKIGYGTELTSVELNFRRPIRPWLTALVGFRYFNFDDDYEVRGQLTPVDTYRYFIDMDNDLYGAQFGATTHLFNRGGRLRVEGAFKGGLYSTHATLNSGLDINETREFSTMDTGSSIALVGDLAFQAVYQINSRAAVRAGYQWIWFNEVALAVDQFGGNGEIQTTSSPLVHGLSLGLEYAW